MNTELQNKEVQNVVESNTVESKDVFVSNGETSSKVAETATDLVKVLNKKDKKDKYNKNKDKITNKKDKKEKKIAKQIEKLQKRQEKKVNGNNFPIKATNSGCSEIKSVGDSYDPSIEYKFTRPCSSLIKGDKCDKGLECTFAHSMDQLKLTNCNFGNNCKNIICGKDIIQNANNGKVCTFIHRPIETQEMYCKRVYTINNRLNNGFKERAPKVFSPKPYVAKTFVGKPIVDELCVEKPFTNNQNVHLIEVGDKIVIDVPKNMMVEILEMLVKIGKTNIELRIH